MILHHTSCHIRSSDLLSYHILFSIRTVLCLDLLKLFLNGVLSSVELYKELHGLKWIWKPYLPGHQESGKSKIRHKQMLTGNGWRQRECLVVKTQALDWRSWFDIYDWWRNSIKQFLCDLMKGETRKCTDKMNSLCRIFFVLFLSWGIFAASASTEKVRFIIDLLLHPAKGRVLDRAGKGWR